MSGHALKTLPRETDLSAAPTVRGEDCLDKATGAVIGHPPVPPLHALYGDGIGVRAQGLFNMMRIAPRMFRK
ncbi:MAG: hypothetical protein SWC96_02270 [Thermodesulfobacteriota bacterium]|nr:hypothetical protein [Thermodesulfobacteriota bacterium]